MRTEPTTTRVVALASLVALTLASLAPAASAIPSAGGGTYAYASASESRGTVCASVTGVRSECVSTIARTSAAFYVVAGAQVNPEGCQTHYCPPVDPFYYGYVTPDGRNYIVIGPGPNPPPGCTYTCPQDVLQWVLDQLP